jgi:hypothetical protein
LDGQYSLAYRPINASGNVSESGLRPRAHQGVLEYHDNSISGKNRERASRSTASEQSPELGRRKSGWQSSSSGCREPKTGQWDNLMVAELRATRSVAHIGSMTRLNEFLTAAEFDALEQVDEGRNRPIPKNF